MTRAMIGTVAGALVGIVLFLAASGLEAGVLIGGQPNPAWENNSMLLWLKADAGVFQDIGGTNPAGNNNSVALWLDQSNHDRKAEQATVAHQPTLNTSGLNGHTALMWDGARYMLLDNSPTDYRTLFLVYQDTSTRTWATPVGATSPYSYHGHSDGSQVFNATYTATNTRNGESYRDGVLYDWSETPRPENWALDVHVAAGALTAAATTIGADNHDPANRHIDGGIAEIILYDRALSLQERDAVGYYLARKYDLQTTYYTPHTPSVYSATVLGDRATQYYRLDETTSTVAVNAANPGSHNGTYTGTFNQGGPGALADPANAAVHFNGAGHVAVGDLGARPSQGTIEFWMYSDVVENHRNPLSTSGVAGGNEGFRFEQNSAGNFNVRVGSDGGATHQPHTLTTSLTAGQWYHVAVTWDSDTDNLQGYLNGRRIFNSTHTGGFPTDLPQVEIGRGFSTSAERWWKGSLDEVAFYDTRLNMADVQWHYQLASIDDSNVAANSIAEFSGVQGQDNWYYGSGAGSAFAQLGTYLTTPSGLIGNPGPHWRGSSSGGYPRLWDAGGHPANDDSEPATRRWISDVTGLVRISGRLAKYDTLGGDGIVGEVLVNGVPALSQAIRQNDDTGVNYTTYAWVQAGQPIDFAINRRSSHSNDSTKFTAIVEAMPSATKVFDLAADFDVAENSAANTWHYVRIDGNTRDGSYSLLPGPHSRKTGIDGWADPAGSPGIWKNTTDTAQAAFVNDLLSAGAVSAHPSTADGVAAAWVAPYWGFVDIDGFVKLIDPNSGSGNGVNWYLDLGDASGNLDSGFLNLATGPGMQSFSVRGLEVRKGEVIYLSVLNRGALSSDNTQMSMVISIIPEPGSMILLGMGFLLVIGLRWRKPKMVPR